MSFYLHMGLVHSLHCHFALVTLQDAYHFLEVLFIFVHGLLLFFDLSLCYNPFFICSPTFVRGCVFFPDTFIMINMNVLLHIFPKNWQFLGVFRITNLIFLLRLLW